jgi:predicted dehydrogenase
MDRVRFGVIGIGGMGGGHARSILDGNVDRAELTAVCDLSDEYLSRFDDSVLKFKDHNKFLQNEKVDAVIIATPHYSHTPLGIAALDAGKHVLVEKPISVHKADCEKLMSAHTNKDQVFAAMFQLRCNSINAKVKSLIDNGELGKLIRVNWIITTWYRTAAYYRQGGWRGTWKGEGGGVLMNQAPHQLDLFQWFCGMPVKVRGFCGLGKRHDVEVEDEVTAYMEYENGATGAFISSTCEAPGTNRLEITGENGRLILEDGEITFRRNEVSALEWLESCEKGFRKPPVWDVSIPVKKKDGKHAGIMNNFVDAILDGEELIAPAEEGVKSVELANAILYSSLKDRPVDLPLDGKEFEAELARLQGK